MLSHTNVHVGRRDCVSLALVGLAIVVPACFLPVPPVDADPSSESSSAAGSSTGEMPTTGGESTSTGEPGSTSSGSTSGASTSEAEAEGSDGTTEFSLPTCPYDPPRSKVMLETSEDGDLMHQACGTTRKFEQLQLGGFGGTVLEFAVCSDAVCGNCVANEKVLLNVSIPDPFEGYGGGVMEGGCYELEVKWERASKDEPELCVASTVRIQRLVDGEPLIVPSMLYRLVGMLDVVDEVGGDFSLTAAEAGQGTIKCPCDGDGDCCRDAPGTRDVQFTVTIDGAEFAGEPLMAEQSQEVKLGEGEGENSAGISLVRSHFPSECAAPGVFEWVFRHPSTF